MLWRQRAWRANALSWAHRSLAKRGIALVGKPEGYRVRPWATVIPLPTDRGLVYFKAIWPPERREAAITEALARWRPKCAPDRRAATLATQYEDLLRARPLLGIGLKDGLTQEQHGKLVDLVPQVRERCWRIAGTVPDTIQHDDLHDGQVFLKDGRYRILDWGDTVVSHPFYSLTVALRSIGHTFKL